MSTSFANPILKSAVIALGLVSIVATSTRPEQPKPKGDFISFGCEPSVICINQGVPIVRVSFRAKSSNTQCVNIMVNGVSIVSPFNSPISSITGQNRCGSGEWGETYSLSLSELFGNNIPPTITVTGELKTGGAVTANQTILDTATAQVASRVCDRPGFISR
jgi:hypothetical protein